MLFVKLVMKVKIEVNKWADHLNHWKLFLTEMLKLTQDKPGEQTKIKRQLTTISSIQYGAVLNPNVLLSFIQPSASKITFSDLRWNINLNTSQKCTDPKKLDI